MENITDFDFYIKFTKPLILNLPQINDRVLAAAWVKKLKEDASAEEKIKLDYLKLLLFVLQRKRLAPPFTQHPNSVETLTAFPQNKTLIDVAKSIIEKENEEKRQKALKRLQGESGDYPPYVSDFSADLLEYVAIQNIENFGVHGYYAVSKLPLSTWYRVDKHLLPKAAKSMIEMSPGPPPLIGTISSPELAEKTLEKSGPLTEPTRSPEGAVKPEPPPPSEEKPPEERLPEPPEEGAPPSPPKKRESPKKSTIGSSPPSRPIGKIVPSAEEREPPTWGSNLLEVKDVLEEEELPDMAVSSTPKKVTDAEVLWSSAADAPYQMIDIFDENYPYELFDASPPSFGPPSFLRTSLAAASGSPDVWTSAASLPYMTPPIPTVAPPPRKPIPPHTLAKRPSKKAVPTVRPTRASLLLQKKTTEAAAPKPPPPEKKPIRRPRPRVPPKSSKTKVEAVPSVSEESVKKPPVGKKTIKKIKGKAKKPTPKGAVPTESTSEVAMATSAIQDPFRGFDELDEVDRHLTEYQKMLGEVEQQYKQEMKGYTERWGGEEQYAQAAAARGVSKHKPPLSRIAKLTGPKISKGLDVPVALEESIHISDDAQDILQAVVEAPAPSGTTQASLIRHPVPRLPPSAEDEADEEAMDKMLAKMRTQLKKSSKKMIATTSTPSRGKDHKLGAVFNQAVQTAINLSSIQEEDGEGAPEYDAAALEALGIEGGVDLGDLDMDVANISGNVDDLNEAMSRLQAEGSTSGVPQGAVSLIAAVPGEDDFETMERLVEEEMRQKGEDPHARSKKRKLSRKKLETGRKQFLAAHARADAQMEQLTDEAFKREELMDADDFETLEKMVEEEMQEQGEDPHARAKKRKFSRKKLASGRKRFLQAHARAEAQLDELTDEETKRQELQEQLEDLYRSLQPNVPPEARTPPMFSKYKAIRDVAAALNYDAAEGVEFVPATEFFAAAQPAMKVQEVFPQIEFTGGEGLDDEPPQLVSPRLPSPQRREKLTKEIDEMFDVLVKESPAMGGVPVTSPRPSASPRRPSDVAKILEGELPPEELNVSYVEPTSPTDAFGLPHLQMSPLKPASERRPKAIDAPSTSAALVPVSPKKTPPQASSPPMNVDIEDDIYWTTAPEDMPPMSPGKFEYQSPPRRYYELFQPNVIDTSGVSPKNVHLYDQLDELHHKLWGSPKTPTVFDIPVSPLRGESPPQLVSPARSPLSPPIDASALRAHIHEQMPLRLQMPVYKAKVGGKHVVNRYSYPRIPSAITERPDLLTEEDAMIQEELRKFKKKKRGREVFRLPYKKRRFIQRHAPPPRLETVKEVMEPSPPKTRPDMWDLPNVYDHMATESPPHAFFSIKPVSPPDSPEDPEALKASIRGHEMVPYMEPYSRRVDQKKHLVQRRSPAPQLAPVHELIESLGEEEWYHRNLIAQQRPIPEIQFPKKKVPSLATIEEIVEYDPSPLSRRAAPASPSGREGPRRRTLRKRLSKRRIDFSQPSSPDESEVQVEQLETEVEERQLDILEEIELSPGFYQLLHTPPGMRRVVLQPGESPKTPPVNLLDLEEQPEDMDRLIEVTPPSPMSEYQTMQKILQEVKEHQMVPREGRRRKIRDMIRQRKGKLPNVEEVPVEERAAVIHDIVEAEVEAELAAQAEEERAKQYNYLDEPVPGGLPSPLKPQTHVPFYSTPPELRISPKKSSPKKYRLWPSTYRDILQHERMPDLVPPDSPSPRQPSGVPPFRVRLADLFDEASAGASGISEEEFPEGSVSPASGRIFDEPPTDAAGISGEEFPEGFASPPNVTLTAEEVERRALMQYQQLAGSPARAPSPKRSLRRPLKTMQDIEQDEMEKLLADPNRRPLTEAEKRAALQYAQLGASPGRSPSPARRSPKPVAKTLEDVEFEELEKILNDPALNVLEVVPREEMEAAMVPEGERTPVNVVSVAPPLAPRRPSPVARTEEGPSKFKLPPQPPKRQWLIEKRLSKKKAQPPTPKTLTASSGLKPEVIELAYEEKVSEPAKPKAKKVPSGDKIVGKGKALVKGKAVVKGKGREAVRGKGKAKGKAVKETPSGEVEYDLAALQELGLSAADLQQINLNDLDMDVGQIMPEAAASPRAASAAARVLPFTGEAVTSQAAQATARVLPFTGEVASPRAAPATARVLPFTGAAAPPVERLPLPIRPLSPDSPPAEHMAQMYKTLATTESQMHPLPVPAGLNYLPTKYKLMLQRLPKVMESEDEYKPPSPMGWNMRWDLSPETRVNMRIPDIQVPLSPLEESRYQFQQVKLESPPRVHHHAPLPLVVDPEIYWRLPAVIERGELDMGLDHETEPEHLEPGAPPLDVFERVQKLAEQENLDEDDDRLQIEELEGYGYDLEEEEPPGYVVEHSPTPVGRVTPEPPSPETLKAELRAHEIYDPERKRMKKHIRIRGKKIPLRGAKAPELEPLYEGTPPKRASLIQPDSAKSLFEIMSRVDEQYDALMSNEPIKPKTPSPEMFKYLVKTHKFEPRLYHREFITLGSRSPNLSPPIEALEQFHTESSPQRFQPIPIALPRQRPHGEAIEEFSPPQYESPESSPEPDIWEEEAPSEATPPKFYSPPPTPSPTQAIEDAWGEMEDEDLPLSQESPVFATSPTQTAGRPIYYSPQGVAVDPIYKTFLPSPEVPKRFVSKTRPGTPMVHDLPEVLKQPLKEESPPTPKTVRAERVKIKRRLDFGESPPGGPVRVLTAVAQVHAPGSSRMPGVVEEMVEESAYPEPQPIAWSADVITSPQRMEEELPDWDREIPPHLRDFKWMDQDF